MKHLKKISIAILSFLVIFNLHMYANTLGQFDNHIVILGKVVDAKTKKPIAFVSVTVEGSNIGTVTNTEGKFKLQFDRTDEMKFITFKYISYKNETIAIDKIPEKDFIIKLTPSVIPLDEIIIRPNNPKELIKEILAKIPDNYDNTANKETAFYREYIKKKRKYVSVSEAVVEIYKTSYNKEFSEDQVKLYKGHKSANVKAQDTIIMKLKGGPKTALLLDVAKHPYILFANENLEQYNFSVENITTINDEQNYIINFTQKPNQEYPLFNGKLYVNVKTLAITAAEFSLNLENKVAASKVFVRKKPLLLTIRPEYTHYIVNYSEQNGKYYFSHARGEVQFSVKWKRKLFKSHYTVMTEIAVTDKTNKNVKKIPKKEQLGSNIIFDEKVYPFSDPDFWGKYNTIKPEEPIEKVIQKYGVMLNVKKN